ncbi:MAG TPA: FAD-dependent oxidoreductase, partial [Armatimonadota bacterium]
MQTVQHTVDVCVVGGGLSGLCAAVAAARQGASVVLMHDRPVLGGNASSEIRVWVQGAYGSWDASVRETGLIEEIMLDTLAGNPGCSWSLWDLALHALAQRQPGLTTLLNCACVAGEVEGLRVRGVRGWQGTTQTWHEVHATQFIDASGDSILAMLSGAEVRRGREAASEFREPDASAAASDITMGNSLLFIWRDMGSPQPFHAPDWAYRYPTEAEAPRHPAYFHASSPNGGDGSFYVETGGRLDTIHDAEALREELLKIGLGLVDHLKNHGDHGMEQLNLEWFGMLPGKRESWRYVGDVVFTENDAAQGTVFPDIVAYGGWPIDDHHPDGTLSREGDSDHVWHKVACPYGIPYRALYSRSHDNLLCAGRNISATHLGLCTTRV